MVSKTFPAPRFQHVPERYRSLGGDSAAFADRVGIPLDGHQRLVLDATMGVDKKGRWSSPIAALVEPRQNGKSSVLIARCLFGMFELGEMHVLFSGHMWQAVHEAFLATVAVVEGSEELLEQVEKIRYSASDLGLTLENGGRLRFVTRSRQASRGASGDLIVFDEAGWLNEATHSALLPTLSARSSAGKVQVFYAGTAVDQTRHPDGAVLAALRRRGMAGEDEHLAYLEWSAEALDEDGNELAPDRVPDSIATDPEVQRQANPAIPDRMALSHVAWECSALDRRSFSVERLGIGDWPTDDGTQGPIDLDVWRSLADDTSEIVGPVCVAFDVAPNRQSSIAIAGRREDSLFHVEITDHRLTVAELLQRVQDLQGKWWPWLIVADPFGIAATACDRLDELGVQVQRVNGGQHAEAVGLFMDVVNEETIRHLGSGELEQAIRGAKLRNVGDAHLWSRRHASVDVSPLVAASLAVWAASGMPEEGWRPQIF